MPPQAGAFIFVPRPKEKRYHGFQRMTLQEITRHAWWLCHSAMNLTFNPRKEFTVSEVLFFSPTKSAGSIRIDPVWDWQTLIPSFSILLVLTKQNCNKPITPIHLKLLEENKNEGYVSRVGIFKNFVEGVVLKRD